MEKRNGISHSRLSSFLGPNELVPWVFKKNSSLDYCDSGADLGLSGNMLESFLISECLPAMQFRKMQKEYVVVPINGNRSVLDLQKKLIIF